LHCYFSNSNRDSSKLKKVYLFKHNLKVFIFQIISTICYKNCKTWKVWNLCFRFCVAYFWNKRYTWFCNENNQDRHGFFNINDQSEHAYLNNNESLEFRRLETNLVRCLIKKYKSKFLKFIFTVCQLSTATAKKWRSWKCYLFGNINLWKLYTNKKRTIFC